MSGQRLNVLDEDVHVVENRSGDFESRSNDAFVVVLGAAEQNVPAAPGEPGDLMTPPQPLTDALLPDEHGQVGSRQGVFGSLEDVAILIDEAAAQAKR
jgi:hypothetical protein